MLVMLGGRERTEAEWRVLLAQSGFTLDHVVPGGPGTFLEAAPGEPARLPSADEAT